MRIAIFNESLPPLTDGVARTFTRLAESLDEAGIDFRFFSPVAPREGAQAPWRGRVRLLPSFAIPMYDYYRCAIPQFQGLARELAVFKPDLVHVTTPTLLGFWGLGYALRRRLPLVSSYHTHFVDYFPYYGARPLMPLGWALLRAFHNACLRTLAPSRSALARLRENGITNGALWQRGVDVRRFTPRKRRPRLRKELAPGGGPLLLFVGRLVNEKGLDDLVAAAKAIKALKPGLGLVLAGDGPERARLQAALPWARLPGFVEGRALEELYASADLLLFPSPTETFGNVVLEAMASGLPVVGVRQGGVADLVQHGQNGLLAEPGRPLSLAELALTAFPGQMLHRRLRQGALRQARRHSWAAINGALIAEYRKLAHKGSPHFSQA